jgi:hypothetical protein
LNEFGIPPNDSAAIFPESSQPFRVENALHRVPRKFIPH